MHPTFDVRLRGLRTGLITDSHFKPMRTTVLFFCCSLSPARRAPMSRETC